MHGQCLLTLTTSLLHMWKMLLYSIIFVCYLILFNACHVCIWPCFIHFCYAELPYLTTQRASPCSQFWTYPRDLLARRHLCTAASRASGLAVTYVSGVGFIMMEHKVQFSVHFKYMVQYSHHPWIQLAVALMYYYTNTASSIRRDLTRRLSFIIISIWLFGEQKCSILS